MPALGEMYPGDRRKDHNAALSMYHFTTADSGLQGQQILNTRLSNMILLGFSYSFSCNLVGSNPVQTPWIQCSDLQSFLWSLNTEPDMQLLK